MLTRVASVGHIAEVILVRNEEGIAAKIPSPVSDGFSAYMRGRLAEDIPMYAERIDAESAVAHHLGATLALDSCYGVTPSEKANSIRKGLSACGVYHRHLSRLLFSREGEGSGLPSLVVTGGLVEPGAALATLRLAGEGISILGGRGLTPERGIPGGLTSGLSEEEIKRLREIAESLLQFAIGLEDGFLRSAALWVKGEGFEVPIPSLALVDEDGKSSLFDGELRLVDPDGVLIARGTEDVLSAIEGTPYRVGVLARLNVAGGIPTQKGEEALERLWDGLGAPPIHRVSAGYWGTVVELIEAAEVLIEALAGMTPGDDDLRTPLDEPGEGVGAIESADGTLIHRYSLDPDGIVEEAEVILPAEGRRAEVETGLAVALGEAGEIDEPLIERIELVIRAFQPALVPEAPFPLRITLRGEDGGVIEEWRRG